MDTAQYFNKPLSLLSFLLLTGCLASFSATAAFDAKLQSHIRAATFEVVVKKPETDNATYEKPLPLELLPFAIRNDAYIGKGTAFLMGRNELVTAAHVFHIGEKTQYPPPVLRDPNGHIFHIDKIVKYSLDEDFVVFTVKEKISATPLSPNPKPTVGSEVSAVGNALGEGVVIRNGSYTSDTAEERSGRWKWLRFSAAASPGNSGGPLLDEQGNVIGIVLRKSPNENLNFALPISRVLDAKHNVAHVEDRTVYQLEVADVTQRKEFISDIALPKTFEALDAELRPIVDSNYDSTVDAFFANNHETIFPRGDGSHQLLHIHKLMTFPTFVTKRSDGKWDVSAPEKIARAEVGRNGVMGVVNYKGTTLINMRRPDDQGHKDFYSDSKLFLDNYLKGAAFSRVVGTEKIRVTSAGKAQTDEWFTDSYGRKWQVRIWPLEFADISAVALMLPVPSGYATMLAFVPTSLEHRRLVGFKHLADFLYVSYQASFARWEEFLADRALLPVSLTDVRVRAAFGKHFEFQSKRFGFEYDNDLQPIRPDSALTLQLSYLDNDAKVDWEVVGATAYLNLREPNSFSVSRQISPSADTIDELQHVWNQIEKREHPFDLAVSVEKNVTRISSVMDAANGKAATSTENRVAYIVNHQSEGAREQAAMKAELLKFQAGVKVLE